MEGAGVGVSREMGGRGEEVVRDGRDEFWGVCVCVGVMVMQDGGQWLWWKIWEYDEYWYNWMHDMADW